jgi:hypothetical protein
MVYANGGFLYHPETGKLMQNAPSVTLTGEFINKLEQNGILRGTDGTGTAAIVPGGAEDLAAFIDAGNDVGIVPYPWGPNVKVNARYHSMDGMLTGNYRTAAPDAGIFVLTAGDGETPAIADADSRIVLAFAYYGLAETLEEDKERERQGLPPSDNPAAAFDGLLAPEDIRRLEWIYNRPVMIAPFIDKNSL